MFILAKNIQRTSPTHQILWMFFGLLLITNVYSVEATQSWKTSTINQDGIESYIASTTNLEGRSFYLLFNDSDPFYFRGIPLFDFDRLTQMPERDAKVTIYTSRGVFGTYDIQVKDNKAMLLIFGSADKHLAFLKLIEGSTKLGISYSTTNSTNADLTFSLNGLKQTITNITEHLPTNLKNTLENIIKPILDEQNKEKTGDLFEKMICALRKKTRDNAISSLKSGLSFDEAKQRLKKINLDSDISQAGEMSTSLNEILETDIYVIYHVDKERVLEKPDYSENLFLSCISSVEIIDREGIKPSTSEESRYETLHDIFYSTFESVTRKRIEETNPSKSRAEIETETKITAFNFADCFVSALKTTNHKSIDSYIDLIVSCTTINDAKNKILATYAKDESSHQAFINMNKKFQACIATRTVK